MIATTFLAQYIGILFVVLGTVGIFRSRLIQKWLTKAIIRPSVFFLIGVFEFMAGLLLVLGHQTWTSFPAVIISLLSWLLVLESLFYLIAPRASIVHLLAQVDKRDIIIATSIVFVGVGVVLALFGFGLI